MSSDQIGWTAPVYVAETDAEAATQAKPHMEELFNKFLALPFEILFPPGHLGRSSFKRAQAQHRR